LGGDVAAATRLLGRPWAIEGIVGPGAQRGRTIGFPTANVGLGDYVQPRLGVYAVQVDVGDGVWRPGVANIGVKPTVASALTPLLEAHIFDFSGDLYGRRLETRLSAFIRDERKFDNFPALLAQIEADAQTARRLLL
jgi:riboflavin kinase/FMN adenylyltransferase